MKYPMYTISGTLVSCVVSGDDSIEYLASVTADDGTIENLSVAMSSALEQANQTMNSETELRNSIK